MFQDNKSSTNFRSFDNCFNYYFQLFNFLFVFNLLSFQRKLAENFLIYIFNGINFNSLVFLCCIFFVCKRNFVRWWFNLVSYVFKKDQVHFSTVLLFKFHVEQNFCFVLNISSFFLKNHSIYLLKGSSKYNQEITQYLEEILKQQILLKKLNFFSSQTN